VNSEDGFEHVTIQPPSAQAVADIPAPTIWTTFSFANDWLTDACKEVWISGLGARRREIIFAVCFAESYLFEWVRDEVVGVNAGRGWRAALYSYFPKDDKSGIKERWKAIPKRLKSDGLIQDAPDLGRADYKQWLDLVDYRDGLVHGSASRPSSSSAAAAPGPIPSPHVLVGLEPGWAVSIVVSQAMQLNQAAGTTAPEWLRTESDVANDNMAENGE
jgi:hypothetical protein